MSSVPIQIVRRQDKALVDAVLHTELKARVLVETEKEWGPIRMGAARKLNRAGKVQDIPQHFHWDWGEKSQKLKLLAYQCLGIECDGKLQGLLMVKLAGQVARLAPDQGKDIVYIDYLESAPWNLATMVDAPLYGGIGPTLMQAAVELRGYPVILRHRKMLLVQEVRHTHQRRNIPRCVSPTPAT